MENGLFRGCKFDVSVFGVANGVDVGGVNLVACGPSGWNDQTTAGLNEIGDQLQKFRFIVVVVDQPAAFVAN